MEVEADKYFSSSVDVCTSMPYELSYSAPESWHQMPWVFWSQRDIELQSIHGFSSPSFETTKEKIKLLLQSINKYYLISNGLIQFWAPVKIADKIYLTTADQPFALYRTVRGFLKGLCTYRKLCLENILIPVDVDELGGEEHNLGLPGRVFRHRIHEICWDINDYLDKEYLQRDRALELGIGGSMAFPVKSVGQDCIGVLEVILSKEDLLNLPARSFQVREVLLGSNIVYVASVWTISTNCKGWLLV